MASPSRASRRRRKQGALRPCLMSLPRAEPLCPNITTCSSSSPSSVFCPVELPIVPSLSSCLDGGIRELHERETSTFLIAAPRRHDDGRDTLVVGSRDLISPSPSWHDGLPEVQDRRAPSDRISLRCGDTLGSEESTESGHRKPRDHRASSEFVPHPRVDSGPLGTEEAVVPSSRVGGGGGDDDGLLGEGPPSRGGGRPVPGAGVGVRWIADAVASHIASGRTKTAPPPWIDTANDDDAKIVRSSDIGTGARAGGGGGGRSSSPAAAAAIAAAAVATAKARVELMAKKSWTSAESRQEAPTVTPAVTASASESDLLIKATASTTTTTTTTTATTARQNVIPTAMTAARNAKTRSKKHDPLQSKERQILPPFNVWRIDDPNVDTPGSLKEDSHVGYFSLLRGNDKVSDLKRMVAEKTGVPPPRQVFHRCIWATSTGRWKFDRRRALEDDGENLKRALDGRKRPGVLYDWDWIAVRFLPKGDACEEDGDGDGVGVRTVRHEEVEKEAAKEEEEEHVAVVRGRALNGAEDPSPPTTNHHNHHDHVQPATGGWRGSIESRTRSRADSLAYSESAAAGSLNLSFGTPLGVSFSSTSEEDGAAAATAKIVAAAAAPPPAPVPEGVPSPIPEGAETMFPPGAFASSSSSSSSSSPPPSWLARDSDEENKPEEERRAGRAERPHAKREEGADSVGNGNGSDTEGWEGSVTGGSSADATTAGQGTGEASNPDGGAVLSEDGDEDGSQRKEEAGAVMTNGKAHAADIAAAAPADDETDIGGANEAKKADAVDPPHAPPPSPSEFRLWLRLLDSGDGMAGRLERYAPDFEREFGCLRHVALAADRDGVDTILEDCNVIRRGDKACLGRAIEALPPYQ